ncbi:putative Ig domain-containing protein, partial [Frateuria sp. Soil773]|uniref:beta strand repeat-containing protein n=1 Tax=Frateuria sp. Soil773 TaxID=1736407 RepID=UPI0019106E61
MGPAWAACPSIVNLTVAAGGTVAIPCAQQWGFLEVDPATTYPTDYGHVNVIPGWTYAPQYVNTSGAGQTDSFYLTDGETGAGIGDPNARVHLIITILPTGLTVNPATLPAATVGTFYTQTFTASGGTTPYHYAATTTLPAGLSLDNSTGVLNGIPTATGSTSITVKATDANNVSGTVSPTLVVNAGVPGKPTITGATATTSGGLPAASIAFSTPPDNGSAITGYTVTASPSNATYTGTGSPILATNLTAGTTYTFTVKATNGVGPGPASDPSAGVIAKRDQTIAFANPGTQNFGTTPTLTATATSGLMPTFSSSTTSVCTVTSGGTLTFGSTGICSITASQSGDGSYFAAPDVSQQFSVAAVAPGAPTIGTATAGNAQAEVSFTAPASNGGAAITGYTVTSDNGITATGTGSPITVTGLQNGTAYTFTVTATNAASITGSPSAASNQVTPTAPQTIGGFSATPGAPVFTQGGTFAVAATASSGLPVSFGITSASSSVCSIAGSTVTMLSPGTCSVTADQAGNAAYQPAPQQTLAVVISAPPPPVAGPVNATVGYSSSANTITPVITGGTADTIAVTPATHGTATVNGLNIVYTPTVGYSGNDSFAYTASNAGGTSAPAMVTVQVSNPSITISTSAPLTANVGSTYSQTFTWSGGNAPYAHYSVDNLPAGLGITGSTADSVTISGTPTAAGTFNLIASARDSSTGNGPFTTGQLFTLTVNAPALALSPAGGTLAGSYGNAYSQAFGASGGTAPYGYSLIGTLPAGLSFDAATGSISGTPTQTGSFPISVTAIDSSTGTGAPFSVSNSYTLQISAATITLTPTTLPNGTVGTAYPAASFGASGGIGPYSYAAGTLPAGMVLSAGQLAGTPTEAGSFSVTVTATDAHGQTGSHVYNFNIGAPVLTLAPASLPNATAETAYSQTLGASGGTAPYSYAFTGNLPTGITFDSSTGTLSGTATVSGDFSFTVKATDSSTGAGAPFSVMQNYTLHIDAPTVTVTPATLPAAIAGTAYPTTALSASGGAGPYSYALTGTLPAGLGFDAGTATFAGTPTETGSFTFAVTATDAHGFTGTANYTLAVSTGTLSLAPGSLPDATAETAYSQVLAASGGVAPYAYTVANGSLPAGLSLDSGTGTLSGTPTVSGDFSVDIKATDSSTGTGAPASVTKTYALHVAAPVLTLTPASLADGTVGVAYSAATLSASGGIGPYTYVLTGTLPAGMSFNAGTATLSGTPSAAGSFPLTATATDAHGFTATAHYTLKIAAAT